MASTFSKDLEIYTAKQFKDSVSTRANVYLTFGRPQPWSDEFSPPQANTSPISFYETWKYMIGGKRITGNDIRHVLPRFDWTSNTVYTAYDHMIDSKELLSANTPHYVITDTFNVYKCIANNYGRPSTYKPTSTNPSGIFQTADKYYWKYMYTLSVEEQTRFTTSSFFPVKTLLENDSSLQWQVQDSAVAGGLNSILLTNNGVGYTSNNISVTITGDGRFANAYAVRNVTTSTIDSIIIDVNGSGYTYANATITSSQGAHANARVIIDPPGGHGYDALHELGGSYLIINPKLNGSEGGKLPIVNDFRQISFLQDPKVYQSSNLISNSTFSQVSTLSLGTGSSADFIEDEIVYQGTDLANATFKGVVAEWDSGNSLIKLTNTEGSPTATLLVGSNSAASKYMNSVTYPDLEPYSGYILYKDNIESISRNESQSEDFKIVLSF